MNRVFRTVVTPLEHAATVTAAAAAIGPATLPFSWTALAGPLGGPATHQISSGLVSEAFAQALTAPEALRAALAPVAAMTPSQAQTVLSVIDVSIEEAPLVLERLGLVLEQSGGGDER